MAIAGAAIGILSDLELWSIFSCVEEAVDLLRCSHVSSEWRAQADDPAFWRRMCAKLWTGKAYVPRVFIAEQGDGALPRKTAYFKSIVDGIHRSELRAEELCSFTWERLRNDADVDLDYTERADPSDVKGDVCHFRPSSKHPDRGLMSSLPGESGFGMGAGEDMRWIISKLVDRRTQKLVTCLSNGPLNPWASEFDDDSDDDSDGDLGQYYPPKPIWRTENWGWKCRNEFATYTMIGTSASFRQDLEKIVSAKLTRRRQQSDVADNETSHQHYPFSASSEDDEEVE